MLLSKELSFKIGSVVLTTKSILREKSKLDFSLFYLYQFGLIIVY